jgi:hypothetical protein
VGKFVRSVKAVEAHARILPERRQTAMPLFPGHPTQRQGHHERKITIG